MPRQPDPNSRCQRAIAAGISRSNLRNRENGMVPRSECISAKAKAAGVNRGTVYARLQRGLSLDDALKPGRTNGRR